MKKNIKVLIIMLAVISLIGCTSKKDVALAESLPQNELTKLIANKDVNNEVGTSYKPMVKLNDKIYGWVKDLGEVKLGDMEFLGKIENSKGTLFEGLNTEDDNLSSNIYPNGTKIYKWDEKSVLVEDNDTFSICELIK